MRRLTWLALLAALWLALAHGALAQEPKPGRDWYEDNVDLGFRVKAPDGWSFVPPQPGEQGTIGRYVAPGSQFISNPKTGRFWDYTMYMMVFDRRAKEEDGKRRFGKAPEDVLEWVDGNLSPFALRKVEEKKGRVKKIETVEYLFEGTIDSDYEVGFYVMLFKLRPDVEVALGFNGPGGRKFSKYERAGRKLCGTFDAIEVDAADQPTAASGSLRDTKRAALQGEVAKNPGWELYETDNYFVVSSNNDRGFVKELLERLEAIRKVYEETYPPSLAKELRQAALIAKREAEAKGGAGSAEREDPEDPEDPEGEDGEQDPAEGRTVSSRADPMERSRTSVVRVCKDRDEYMSYGGPGGSAGYWSWMQEELVVYDARAIGGRDDTWATLNHEAFHQYIFYFFGSLAPHSWYNEGTGDFYGGYEYKNGKFTLKPFDWRERTIQGVIRDGSYVPLEKFVRFDKPTYYKPDRIGNNYAQGWSLIWFLRTGKKQARCWDDAWDEILPTYLRVLVETDDLDAAVDAAYAGVDWTKLEECWKSYVLQ